MQNNWKKWVYKEDNLWREINQGQELLVNLKNKEEKVETNREKITQLEIRTFFSRMCTHSATSCGTWVQGNYFTSCTQELIQVQLGADAPSGSL